MAAAAACPRAPRPDKPNHDTGRGRKDILSKGPRIRWVLHCSPTQRPVHREGGRLDLPFFRRATPQRKRLNCALRILDEEDGAGWHFRHFGALARNRQQTGHHQAGYGTVRARSRLVHVVRPIARGRQGSRLEPSACMESRPDGLLALVSGLEAPQLLEHGPLPALRAATACRQRLEAPGLASELPPEHGESAAARVLLRPRPKAARCRECSPLSNARPAGGALPPIATCGPVVRAAFSGNPPSGQQKVVWEPK